MNPADLAHKLITEVMEKGSATYGSNDDWKEQSTLFHLTRAIRHATSALMVFTGVLDDEDGLRGHMSNAITRLAMAMWKITLH